MEKEKGKDIVVISDLSYTDIVPINHISLGVFCVFADISLDLS